MIGPDEAVGIQELMARLGLGHKTHFRRRYLKLALDAGLLEMTYRRSASR